MEKYYLKNWRTFPFREKSFEEQLDRFAVASITSMIAPNKIVDIVPVWGRNYEGGMGKFIKLLHQKEQGIELDRESLDFLSRFSKPIDGEFVKIKSKYGPLFRVYTLSEAENGLCDKNKVNTPVRDNEGNVIIYNEINVFTWSKFDTDSLQYNFVKGWSPEQTYDKYVFYRYFPISQLNDFIV